MIKNKLKILRRKREKWWDMSGSMGKGKSMRFLPSIDMIKKMGYTTIYMNLEQSIDLELYKKYLNGKF